MRKVVTFGAHDHDLRVAYMSNTRLNLLHLHTVYLIFVPHVLWERCKVHEGSYNLALKTPVNDKRVIPSFGSWMYAPPSFFWQ